MKRRRADEKEGDATAGNPHFHNSTEVNCALGMVTIRWVDSNRSKEERNEWIVWGLLL